MPTFEGLTVNIDGSFYQVGDVVGYKIIIKNSDNDDYIFADYKNESGTFSSINYSKSEYISYSLYCDDGYLLKANSTKECNLIISYINQVPSELLLATGGFSENNQVVINLGNEKGSLISNLKNPNTASSLLIIVVLLTITLSVILLVILKKYKKLSLLTFILAIAIVPVSVYAVTLLTITVNSRVVISAVGSISNNITYFCYMNDQGDYSNHEYEVGMTWPEYINSQYNTENFFVEYENPIFDIGSVSGNPKIINLRIPPEYYTGNYFTYNIQNENEEIVPFDEACYVNNWNVGSTDS